MHAPLIAGIAVGVLAAGASCSGARDAFAPVQRADSIPAMLSFAALLARGLPGEAPREFAVSEADTLLELRGWIRLSGGPLGAVAWTRDSVLMVTVRKLPCPPELICVELGSREEYRYQIRVRVATSAINRVELFHHEIGTATPVFAAHVALER